MSEKLEERAMSLRDEALQLSGSGNGVKTKPQEAENENRLYWPSAYDSIKAEGDKIIRELIVPKKKQEPDWEGGGSWWFPVCPECHGIIPDYAETCPHCQTPLVWKR